MQKTAGTLYAFMLLAMQCKNLHACTDVVNHQGAICAWLHMVNTLTLSHVQRTVLYATVLHAKSQ